MKKIIPSSEQINFCKEFLKEGPIAHRGISDGDYYQQFFGLLGQVIMGDVLGVERPKNIHGFDGGYDFIFKGQKWDVKNESRDTWVYDIKKSGFKFSVYAHQIHYNCDGYIFLSHNKGEGVYQVLGWISKSDFLVQSQLIKKGTIIKRTDGSSREYKADAYVFPLKCLNRWEKFGR